MADTTHTPWLNKHNQPNLAWLTQPTQNVLLTQPTQNVLVGTPREMWLTGSENCWSMAEGTILNVMEFSASLRTIIMSSGTNTAMPLTSFTTSPTLNRPETSSHHYNKCFYANDPQVSLPILWLTSCGKKTKKTRLSTVQISLGYNWRAGSLMHFLFICSLLSLNVDFSS